MPFFEITRLVEADNITDALGMVGRLKAVQVTYPRTEERLDPALPEHPKATKAQIKATISDDYLICLEDGKPFKSLKRHLMTHYNLTPEQYRAKWGLPADYPMVAPGYSAKRSELAKAAGLGTK